MNEWVLLIALSIIGEPGVLRDVSLSAVGGFSSKAACDTAGQRLAERAVAVVGRARSQRGINAGSQSHIPSLNTECVLIKK